MQCAHAISDGALKHVPLSTHPGMRDHTIVALDVLRVRPSAGSGEPTPPAPEGDDCVVSYARMCAERNVFEGAVADGMRTLHVFGFCVALPLCAERNVF